MSKQNGNAKEKSADNVNGNPNVNSNLKNKFQDMARKNAEQRDKDQRFVKLEADVPHILDFSLAKVERIPNRFNVKQMRYRYSIEDPENPNKEFLEVSGRGSAAIDAQLEQGYALLKITKTGEKTETKYTAIPA